MRERLRYSKTKLAGENVAEIRLTFMGKAGVFFARGDDPSFTITRKARVGHINALEYSLSSYQEDYYPDNHGPEYDVYD